MEGPGHAGKLRLVQLRGVLALVHPRPGESDTFDTDEYSRIDFRSILGQWQSLYQKGDALLILFADRAVIVLNHFFDANGAANESLVQIGEATYVSADAFFQ